MRGKRKSSDQLSIGSQKTGLSPLKPPSVGKRTDRTGRSEALSCQMPVLLAPSQLLENPTG